MVGAECTGGFLPVSRPNVIPKRPERAVGLAVEKPLHCATLHVSNAMIATGPSVVNASQHDWRSQRISWWVILSEGDGVKFGTHLVESDSFLLCGQSDLERPGLLRPDGSFANVSHEPITPTTDGCDDIYGALVFVTFGNRPA